MKYQKVSKLIMLAVLMLVSMQLAGCSRKLIVHPISNTDIQIEGDRICFSKWYFEEVMKAKLQE